MNIDEVIKQLDVLERCLKEAQAQFLEAASMQEEIRYWRERFLASHENGKNASVEEAATAWVLFLGVSSEYMVAVKPEKVIFHIWKK